MGDHREQLSTGKEMKKMTINLLISHLISNKLIKMLIIKLMQDHRKHSPEDKVDSVHLVDKEYVSVEIECEY